MMSLEVPQLMALTVFVSYFAIILGLFAVILGTLYRLPTPATPQERLTAIGTTKFLALASLLHTWLHMFRFLSWSFHSYEATLNRESLLGFSNLDRLTNWLLDTSLFEQAWAAVCFGPFNWWWSQQLCLYTVGAWTVFLATKGQNHGVKHLWAYMLLGQFVAISVASNLFYLALLLSPTLQDKRSKSGSQQVISAPPSLYIPVLLSLIAVIYTPYTSVANGTFLPNLLIMHSIVFIPLIVSSFPFCGKLPQLSLRTLALLLSVISTVLHVRASSIALLSVSSNSGGDIFELHTWDTFLQRVWNTLVAHHPAQSSIGWDVVWTSVSLVAWNLLGGVSPESNSTKNALIFATTSLFAGGGSAPLIFEGSLKTVLRQPKVD